MPVALGWESFPCAACLFSFKLLFKPPFQVGRAEEDLQHSTVLGGAQTGLAPCLLAPNSSFDGDDGDNFSLCLPSLFLSVQHIKSAGNCKFCRAWPGLLLFRGHPGQAVTGWVSLPSSLAAGTSARSAPSSSSTSASPSSPPTLSS